MPDSTDHDFSTPRWVKVFGIISLVVVLLLLILLFFGGGQHGPQRHFRPPGEAHATPQP